MYKAGSVTFLSFCFEILNNLMFLYLKFLEVEGNMKRTHNSFIKENSTT